MQITLGEDIKAPIMSKHLCEHLQSQFSADKLIKEGFLKEGDVSESYRLGFLAAMGYAHQVLEVHMMNQEGIPDDVVMEVDNYVHV